MNCGQARLQIVELLDGALGSEEASAARQHIRNCESCSRFYAEQLSLGELLESVDLQLEPPSRIWTQIEARVQPETRDRWLQSPPFWGLFQVPELRMALAGLGLMLLFSLALFQLPNDIDAGMLAELESYRLEAPENPFLSEVVGPVDGNPFQSHGGGK